MTVADVSAGARAQNAAGLERLARRIVPSVGWDDLVLPRVVEQQLRELTARARHRDRVLGEWGMGSKGARGLGVTGLFAGDSGTGKTMSAEVVAGDLGFDLYVIDLSTVVDKYIGETEKNLDRIFTEADRVNGILLFDEADALFGKRSEVKDARDRYANVEVAYLLQRMELFDGLAILTTNLRSNVDEAFVRRLDAIVDFPMPEEEHRRKLWERNLPASLPVTGDIDLDFLARQFKISGGNIRNVCVERRLPRGRGGPAGRHGGPDPRDRARVPEARPAHGRSGVRTVSGAGVQLIAGSSSAAAIAAARGRADGVEESARASSRSRASPGSPAGRPARIPSSSAIPLPNGAVAWRQRQTIAASRKASSLGVAGSPRTSAGVR